MTDDHGPAAKADASVLRQIVDSRADEILLLTSGLLGREDAERHAALIAVIGDVFAAGYEKGLRRGGKLMAEGVVARASA